MNYLAADDDNGNLNDGTPHMTAIYNAFNDQEIACQTPTVQDSGCAGVPTAAPDVTTTSGDTSISLSWGAVAGATEYEVFRTEGIFACDFGKVKIGSTAGTSCTDTGLQNGRDYSYVVIPKGRVRLLLRPRFGLRHRAARRRPPAPWTRTVTTASSATAPRPAMSSFCARRHLPLRREPDLDL